MSEKLLTPIEIGLTAAIVAIEGNEPVIVTASAGENGKLAGLPLGRSTRCGTARSRSALRAWVEEQAGLRLGYVEQLYTFGDRGRHTQPGDTDVHVAIDRLPRADPSRRQRSPRTVAATFDALVSLLPVGRLAASTARNDRARHPLTELTRWADESEQPETARSALGRKDRVRLYFGTEGAHWDEERVLDRYELLYEAGLIEEARRDGRPAALARKSIPRLGVSIALRPPADSGNGKWGGCAPS